MDTSRLNKKPKSVIAGLCFKGVKGKADPEKRLDLEIKLVNIQAKKVTHYQR